MTTAKEPTALQKHHADQLVKRLPIYRVNAYLTALVPGPLSESHLITLNVALRDEKNGKNRAHLIAQLERHIELHKTHLQKGK